MRAVVVRHAGVVEILEVPTPQPGPGAIRIAVAAATVNPVDLMVRAGVGGTPFAAPRDRWGVGWDVAGTVDAIGTGVTEFTIGQAVIGISDRLDVSLGAQADYVVLEAGNVAPAPVSVSPVPAATLPLNGLTAVQALAALDLASTDTLLVTGAAGAVGGFAVELAAARGLRVIASASPADEDAVRALGATDFVSRHASLPEAVRALIPGGVDAALDAAALGPETLAAVRGGGRFVSISVPNTPIPLRGTDVRTVLVRADRPQLDQLVAHVDAGELTLRVAETLPLTSVEAAQKRLAEGGVRGRLVLIP
ncbi:NADP-dependent oxidoreductase [Nocardia abscessus]|uniref:NADP-dependent oxidoreductase n=1 Tax=Nocardia TaxID=1817 RepID=UPI001892EA79|nr:MULTISPECIES: NADP-dependent oxidoreductase [Nocardia]MBF6220855.1 NADP-dependent oxidoreductase [Nocardia abscessus]MDE1671535.1 NADP-dependent oxidoreductase [Nocardia gipuzkoensis]